MTTIGCGRPTARGSVGCTRPMLRPRRGSYLRDVAVNSTIMRVHQHAAGGCTEPASKLHGRVFENSESIPLSSDIAVIRLLITVSNGGGAHRCVVLLFWLMSIRKNPTQKMLVIGVAALTLLGALSPVATAATFPSREFRIITSADRCLTGEDQHTGIGIVTTRECQPGDNRQVFAWDAETESLKVSGFPSWCVTSDPVPMTLEGDILLAPCGEPMYKYEQGWEQRSGDSRGVEVYNIHSPSWHLEAPLSVSSAHVRYSGMKLTDNSYFRITPEEGDGRAELMRGQQ